MASFHSRSLYLEQDFYSEICHRFLEVWKIGFAGILSALEEIFRRDCKVTAISRTFHTEEPCSLTSQSGIKVSTHATRLDRLECLETNSFQVSVMSSDVRYAHGEDEPSRGNDRSSTITPPATNGVSQREEEYRAVSQPFFEWDTPFPVERRSSKGFAEERNLHVKFAVGPTDSDYESDGSDMSFSNTGTPTASSEKKDRWKAFKGSSIFSRFQRHATMPNAPRAPVSPAPVSIRSHDDVLGKGSVTYMVPYDSENAVALPTNVISLRGLIKLCGRDTVGRPIVVIDASYCPPAHMRYLALAHIREKMEAIVEAGEYNMVFIMSPNPSKGDAHKEVPTMWCLEVYRKLPFSYKKNVRRVILIHPSFIVKLVLNLLRPFLSLKAYDKIVRVHQLAELEKATDGEISLDKLFLSAHVYVHDKSLEAAENSNG